jgi:hypothetical protein
MLALDQREKRCSVKAARAAVVSATPKRMTTCSSGGRYLEVVAVELDTDVRDVDALGGDAGDRKQLMSTLMRPNKRPDIIKHALFDSFLTKADTCGRVARMCAPAVRPADLFAQQQTAMRNILTAWCWVSETYPERAVG